MTFDGSDLSVIGKLQSKYTSGDEGGEFFLNKSVTNTTLNTGVTVDVWQDRLRFFEQGGTARGAFIDISTMQAGVGTNLASYTYLTTAQRTALTPVKGQTVYDTDLGSLLIYYGATTGWRPPWNQPWGIIDHKTDTTVRSITSTTPAEITSVLRSTGTYIANRYLKITAVMTMAHNASLGFIMNVVRSPASSAVTEARVAQQGYNGFSQIANSVVITSTASAVYGLYWASNTAGQSVTNYNNLSGLSTRFTIEDIGPLANNPPAS
jgi:hypothetical protein